MPSITLPRSGLQDLQFSGEQVMRASSRGQGEQTQARWHELSVFRRDDGYWVVHIGYRTTVAGETGNDYVEVINDASEAEPLLSLYNPAEYVAINTDAVPPRGRVGDIVRDLVKQYDLLVCTVLKTLPAHVQAAS